MIFCRIDVGAAAELLNNKAGIEMDLRTRGCSKGAPTIRISSSDSWPIRGGQSSMLARVKAVQSFHWLKIRSREHFAPFLTTIYINPGKIGIIILEIVVRSIYFAIRPTLLIVILLLLEQIL